MTMPALTLVSHDLCPYVQRAAIALAEKRVAFARVYVDLSNKPEWFRAISPLGKVPLLRVASRRGEHVIFESAVILEYLEETQANPLHPDDPLDRARHRSWMEFGSASLNGVARLYNAGSKGVFDQERVSLRTGFERLEAELSARRSGPFFHGDRFSLVDAVFGPVFRYFDVFDAIDDFGVLAQKPKVVSWRSKLAARASVRGAVSADYNQLLLDFLIARKSHLSRMIETKGIRSLGANRGA
ncbi:MAG: glutathione S-transferase family protein [Hyphomicrobiales bacterium]|nr:glutathione S-transferase family protein [Hyphomicrobiales bacterium]